MRLLIIEDDRRLARLIAGDLAEEGCAVDVAHDGETGLDLALGGAFDVAIVDWMLPGRDGPAICRAVRATRLPTALLMLTARGEVEDRVAGLDSGADDYLPKPFAFEELLARVRALGRRFLIDTDTRSISTQCVMVCPIPRVRIDSGTSLNRCRRARAAPCPPYRKHKLDHAFSAPPA